MRIALTSSAKFSPFTFEELLKPYAMVTQEYNTIEEGINELGTKAELMRMYANEEPNSDWSKRYNEYANSLDKQVEALAKNGLTPAARTALLNLKKSYNTSVTPIEEAVAARKEAYKYRDTITAKDNTARFKNRTLSLSDFMNGKTGDNTYVSGKDITSRVMAKAQIEGTALYNQLLEQGMSSTQAMQYIQSGQDERLQKIINDEITSLGLSNYSPEDQKAIMSNINTGMYGAMAKIAEGEYMSKKERESLAMQQRNFNLQQQQLAESKRMHNFEIQQRGYKIDEDGKIVVDKESPYWAERGMIVDENGNIKKAPSETDTQKPTKSFGMPITEGGEGEKDPINEELKPLNGLRQTNTGYSTTSIDNLTIAKNAALKKLNEAKSKISDKDIAAYDFALERSKQAKAPVHVPKEYRDYTKAKKDYDDAVAAFNTEMNKIKSLEEKYYNLGNNTYQRLDVGRRLEEAQSKVTKQSLIYNANNTDYEKVRKGLINTFSSFSEETLDKGGAGLYNRKDNTKLDREEIFSLLNDTNNPPALKVTKGKNPELLIVHKGKEYTIKGIDDITQFNQDIKDANNFLRDYISLGSSIGVDKITTLSNIELDNFTNGNGIPRIKTFRVSDRFRGAIIYNKDSNTYIKVLLNPNNEIETFTTLQDEYENRGSKRSIYLDSMIESVLNKIKDSVAQ